MVERRQNLKDGNLKAGDKSGIMAEAASHIDLIATDNEYKKNKSGLWLVLKISRYMLFPHVSKQGPLRVP
jgi:hypothetical protein